MMTVATNGIDVKTTDRRLTEINGEIIDCTWKSMR
jgi:hypothetical protein